MKRIEESLGSVVRIGSVRSFGGGELIDDRERVSVLEKNIGKLALMDAAMTIVDEIYRIVR